jgi:hypothetical protein
MPFGPPPWGEGAGLVPAGEGLLRLPASKQRGAVRTRHHFADVSVTSVYKLINMQDEKPRTL